jgi:hypothetical protein
MSGRAGAVRVATDEIHALSQSLQRTMGSNARLRGKEYSWHTR